MKSEFPSRDSRDTSTDLAEEQSLIDGQVLLDSDLTIPVGRSSRTTAWTRCASALRVALEIALCLLLLVNFISAPSQKTCTSDDGADSSRSVHETTFGTDMTYMSLDHRYDELWAEEESAYKALVQTNIGAPKNDAQWGSVAMFHQLHCLTSFRAALQKATAGEYIGVDHTDNIHWPHCFWYLRQTILCHADNLVELPHLIESVELPNGTVVTRPTGSVNGANDVRKCHDSKSLYELRLKHGPEAMGYKFNVDAERLAAEQLLKNNTTV